MSRLVCAVLFFFFAGCSSYRPHVRHCGEISLTRTEWLHLRVMQEERKAQIAKLMVDLKACEKRADNPLPWILLGVAVAGGVAGMITIAIVK